MKIAIIYDIQKNYNNLTLALKKISKEKVETIWLLDKKIEIEVAKSLIASKIQVCKVWEDGENAEIKNSLIESYIGWLKEKIKDRSGYKLIVSKDYDQRYEIDGRKIFMTLYPDFAEHLLKDINTNEELKNTNLDNDIIISPDAKMEIRKVGHRILIKPGSLSAAENKSFAIYNTKTNKAKLEIL